MVVDIRLNPSWTANYIYGPVIGFVLGLVPIWFVWKYRKSVKAEEKEREDRIGI